ncbi:hypothetical protein BH24ACI3_BH24ACI3_06050 [soil metagenome]
MFFISRKRSGSSSAARLVLLISALFVGFFVLLPHDLSAQRRFSRNFPATTNVRLQLTNRSGTVTVEGWNRNEVSVSAYLEAPAATITPQDINGTIYINLVKENQGRDDVGNVNFTIRVPFTSSVDIETLMGNLIVSNVRGGLVRAHITSEGDITLTNIDANAVSAQNGIGDIFYDGAIKDGGNYRFTSVRGNINLRIPFSSSFRLVATAPSTRNISLGSFSNANMSFTGDGRRVVGRVGESDATLTVTNQRGNISFIRR